MKPQTKEFLKKKCFVIGVPIAVKFKKRMKPSEFTNFRATKGIEVVKLSDIRKAFRIEKDEVKKIIYGEDDYNMGNILDEDIEGWLK